MIPLLVTAGIALVSAGAKVGAQYMQNADNESARKEHEELYNRQRDADLKQHQFEFGMGKKNLALQSRSVGIQEDTSKFDREMKTEELGMQTRALNKSILGGAVDSMSKGLVEQKGSAQQNINQYRDREQSDLLGLKKAGFPTL